MQEVAKIPIRRRVVYVLFLAAIVGACIWNVALLQHAVRMNLSYSFSPDDFGASEGTLVRVGGGSDGFVSEYQYDFVVDGKKRRGVTHASDWVGLFHKAKSASAPITIIWDKRDPARSTIRVRTACLVVFLLTLCVMLSCCWGILRVMNGNRHFLVDRIEDDAQESTGETSTDRMPTS